MGHHFSHSHRTLGSFRRMLFFIINLNIDNMCRRKSLNKFRLLFFWSVDLSTGDGGWGLSTSLHKILFLSPFTVIVSGSFALWISSLNVAFWLPKIQMNEEEIQKSSEWPTTVQPAINYRVIWAIHLIREMMPWVLSLGLKGILAAPCLLDKTKSFCTFS